MPKPMYFHPFTDPDHYIGVGPKATGCPPSWVSLHAVAPTFGSARFRYGHNLGPNDFARYTDNTHRIYVMGHCSPGSRTLSTETGKPAQLSSCSASNLAAYFVGAGLPDTSQVVIRIHACHSASNHGFEDSFAKRFKDTMNELGYNAITVQGYTVNVGVYFIRRLGGGLVSAANKHRITV